MPKISDMTLEDCKGCCALNYIEKKGTYYCGCQVRSKYCLNPNKQREE